MSKGLVAAASQHTRQHRHCAQAPAKPGVSFALNAYTHKMLHLAVSTANGIPARLKCRLQSRFDCAGIFRSYVKVGWCVYKPMLVPQLQSH